MTWNSPALTATPADRFIALMNFLCESVVTQGCDMRMPSALLALIWQRLTKLAHRFTRIIATAGRKPKPGQPRTHNTRPIEPPAEIRLPTRTGWLPQELPGLITAVGIACAELAKLLHDPEMASLVITHPGLARALRPLCRALGIPRPPVLQRPKPAPAPKSPPKPRAKRPKRLNAAEFDAIYINRFTAPGASPFWPRAIKLR